MKILEVKNISKKLNKKEVLKWVSFSVKKWEIYGFLWPNGAWKTTTMKCILDLIKVESWEINVFWTNGLTLENKKNIWFMPENTYLYKHLKAEEFLKFNLNFFDIPKNKIPKTIKKLLKEVGLEDASKKYLKDFSKWMLQRIGLAQAIANKPKLLFLDEPMSWLDPIWRKMVKDLILKLNKDWTTIFFNTHILADVESICDRVSIIDKGKIIVEWQKVNEIKWSLEDFFIEKVESSGKLVSW